jgi:hypothetical protein
MISTEQDQSALASIKDRLASTQAGSGLRDNLKRHYEHLEALAGSLRKLGMDDHDIAAHVVQIFSEYEHELMQYLQMERGQPAQTEASA